MPKPKQSESTLTPVSLDELKTMREAEFSRRELLRRSGIAATAAGGFVIPVVDDETTVMAQGETPPQPFDYQFQGVPEAPAEPPPKELIALSELQASIVEALTSRILPGTSDDPGAREAGVIYFIDYLLARNSGIHEATYTSWPYARVYDGDTPPEDDNDQYVWIKASEISRYGYQSELSPLDVYEIGIQATENYAREKFGRSVVELEEQELDEIIWDLLDEKASGFDQFSSRSFFHTLRRHTAEGMFSDPAYGGNGSMVGWQLIGYPGAQRAYSAELLQRVQDAPRPPQSLNDLPHFNPGHTEPGDHPNVIQPVRDGDDGEDVDNDGDGH